MRVDYDRDRIPGQLAQFRDDLPGLIGGRAGIDDEHVAPAEDDPDLLVEELEMKREDAVADLLNRHRGMVRPEGARSGRCGRTFRGRRAPVPRPAGARSGPSVA